MADRLADATDFLVLVPNFFRDEISPDPDSYNWHDVLQVYKRNNFVGSFLKIKWSCKGVILAKLS